MSNEFCVEISSFRQSRTLPKTATMSNEVCVETSSFRQSRTLPKTATMSKQQATKLPVALTMLRRHCCWCGPGFSLFHWRRNRVGDRWKGLWSPHFLQRGAPTFASFASLLLRCQHCDRQFYSQRQILILTLVILCKIYKSATPAETYGGHRIKGGTSQDFFRKMGSLAYELFPTSLFSLCNIQADYTEEAPLRYIKVRFDLI